MSSAFEHIVKKLERAEEHINQLEREREAFLNKTPNRELADYDADSEKAFKDFHGQRVVDPRLSVLTGDVLHQLRSSLDHMACDLILSNGGSITLKSQFPIFLYEPTKQGDIRRYNGQIEGVTRPEILTIIKRHQPYAAGDGRGGSHSLAVLKSLSNIDKHRALILHVVTIEARIRGTVRWKNGIVSESDSADLRTETSAELPFESELIDEVNMQRRLTTRISFAQWGDMTYPPVELINGLRALRTAVTDVLNDLVPYFRPPGDGPSHGPYPDDGD